MVETSFVEKDESKSKEVVKRSVAKEGIVKVRADTVVVERVDITPTDAFRRWTDTVEIGILFAVKTVTTVFVVGRNGMANALAINRFVERERRVPNRLEALVVEKSLTKRDERVPPLGFNMFVDNVEIVNWVVEIDSVVKERKVPRRLVTRFVDTVETNASPVENRTVETDSVTNETTSIVDRTWFAFVIRVATIESAFRDPVVNRMPPVVVVERVVIVARNADAVYVEIDERVKNDAVTRFPDSSSMVQLDADNRAVDSVEIVASVVERTAFTTNADGIVITWRSAFRVDWK
jgi:PBP1b-binding outer membrane lipoprotein LpoB